MKKFWWLVCFLVGFALPIHAQKIPPVTFIPLVETEVDPVASVLPLPVLGKDGKPILTWREGVLKVPDELYEIWWKEAMECTGLNASIDSTKKVKFYYVDAKSFRFVGDTVQYIGYTFAGTSQILLVRWGIYVAPLVKHEMTHYLMHLNHIIPDPTDSIPGHPSKYFKKCGYSV